MVLILKQTLEHFHTIRLMPCESHHFDAKTIFKQRSMSKPAGYC